MNGEELILSGRGKDIWGSDYQFVGLFLDDFLGDFDFYIKINNMRITQATRTNWAMVLLSSAVKIAVTSYVIWIALSLYSWYMYGINTTVEEYTVHKKIEEWREILINVTLIGGVVLPGLKTRRNEESAWFRRGIGVGV